MDKFLAKQIRAAIVREVFVQADVSSPADSTEGSKEGFCRKITA